MAQKTEWTCDGCADTAVVAINKTPNDWKRAEITWAGLSGYPSSLADGGGIYDLCPSCSRRLADAMRPSQWPRMAKADVLHG